MSNPVVTVENHASINVFVGGNPDWDDQKVLFNGRYKGRYKLTPGKSIKVSVKWNYPATEEMMGLDFTQTEIYGVPLFYVVAGQDQTGNLAITDAHQFDDLLIRYTVSDQAPWSMTMTLTDATG